MPSAARHQTRARGLFPCPKCGHVCSNQSGLTRHINANHRDITPAADDEEDPASSTIFYHAKLNGKPCDAQGRYLAPNGRPSPPPSPPPIPDDIDADPAWFPFASRIEYDFAHLHYVKEQASADEIKAALDIWTAVLLPYGKEAPWKNAEEMYETIDAIQAGVAPWQRVKMRYTGELPRGTPPKWMTQTYDLYVRDARALLHQQLASEQFRDALTPIPYVQFNKDDERVVSNFMSGDWAYSQADVLGEDENTHGAMFVPVISGSDKTTVSVATGHQEYHPVYISPGCITNTARRAQGDGVLPVAMLPIPKTRKKYRSSVAYQRFCRQLYHACLARVFRPLKPYMTTPEVVKCADGYYRRVIYGLGPYIADYPEQVWLSAIVQGWCPKCDACPDDLDGSGSRKRTHKKTEYLISVFDPGILWSDFGVRTDVVPFTYEFPRADIHELLSPDLLHQVIKGTFKDHLVTWIGEYLVLVYGETRAKEILDDIDRRISAPPSFPNLRRFPEGRDFTQWTGDDSKALMRVYLAAIAGHVPMEMCQCFSSFLDFCYIARRNAISASALSELQQALDRFYQYREIFITTGVRVDISLPRQHSLKHYATSILLFGSPNGLCSSITESKHIKAVKEPWRRSSRHNALGQMLTTNIRIDKMHAARLAFEKRGMMEGSTSSYTARMLAGVAPQSPGSHDDGDEDEEPDAGPRALSSVDLATTKRVFPFPANNHYLAAYVNQPHLPSLLRRFLHNQLYPDASADNLADEALPHITSRVYVYHSAVARFYAPSDLCGAGGMRRERIRSTPNWYGVPRRDTVLVNVGSDETVLKGMIVGRVHLFLSFKYDDRVYPCALVHWFVPANDERDEETGMWMVKPEFTGNNRPSLEIIHMEAIARGVHLIGAYGSQFLPEDFHYSYSLDAFRSFYVNHYSDHHMHEFLSVHS
ncbi:hypothetical protein BD626DRAFT_408644 [Schizophyllum amplum]|uniref:C2H2-type domain-containing protein n=1 Tax=Schizophyllum amplum TaxID=97359 RepID=A0A550C4K3_9AGAR|nr:hypothetical protein BD626DRAFT_410902 [Auriculariopsis ampla]TRM59731.1 hypothetical protein BD626DRAFT_408644 [Auriculariopsis ampla]